MMNHWVVHSNMKPIDVYELLYIKFIIDELGSNLNDYGKT